MKDQKLNKAKFHEKEPPFNYDPLAEGAKKKLNYANKVGSGNVIAEDNTEEYIIKSESTPKKNLFSNRKEAIITSRKKSLLEVKKDKIAAKSISRNISSKKENVLNKKNK